MFAIPHIYTFRIPIKCNNFSLLVHADWRRASARTMEQVNVHAFPLDVRALVLSYVGSCEDINTRTILAHYCATLASIAQRSHTDAICVARFIRSHCTTVAVWRTKSCVLDTSTFSYATIPATLCDCRPKITIARHFGRIWTYLNCKRPFSTKLVKCFVY